MKLEVGVPPSGAPNSVAGRIAAMREKIGAVARAAGRDPSSIALVGVTKKQARESVVAAIEAGLGDVAESYVQEARAKLAGLPAVRKHFIGHVQTNKAKAIVELFDVVQSVDRLEAGRALARAVQASGKRVSVLIQINVSPTERFGVAPEDAPALAAALRSDGLEVEGVMAIGPLTTDRDALDAAFRNAAQAFERIGGTTLSLGMSGDWEEAIRCGSTMLRIGTVIFGARV
ncbi:MAG: YggS family pyridoxal phosphate-dependent enzyme [Vulcanimicrobiaceae bacterium]